MRLEPQQGERIDRSREVSFTFHGANVRGFEGDTLASALYAEGQRIFSRSFKYHRPRGLLCCRGTCPNCMVQVDGTPNVRSCVTPIREGAHVEAQNVWGSLDHDLLAITDKIGGPFTPVGFYYRTMIRPRRAWPLYEKFLRNVAGLGKVDEHAGRANRYDVEHRRAEVLVVGGGASGQAAAREAAAEGRHTVLVDNGPDPIELEGVETIQGTALGTFEGGLVPVDAGLVLYRFRAEHVVVAAGAVEQPLLFPGNDLVGVVLPEAVRRLVGRWSLRPGTRAVVISADDGGLDTLPYLERAGTEVAEVVDLRETRVREIAAQGRGGRLASVELDGRKVACDLLVVSGGRQPAYALLAHAGAKVEYDQARGIFVPTDLPPGIEVVGPAAGETGEAAIPAATYNGAAKKGKCFVCICEDVTDKDVKRADRRGLRLDRARQALHDRDDGALPGQALPRPLHPALRARERDRRGDDRDDDRAPAVAAGRARAPRRAPARARPADGDPPPPQGARRQDDVDGHLAPAALLRRPRGRGEERARHARRHRRLHAREAHRERPRLGGLPRAPLPQPLRRHEGRPHPLRRPQLRRRPDHGRRHARATLGRGLLRHHDVYRRRRRRRVVRVVERDLAHERRDRQRHRRARRA